MVIEGGSAAPRRLPFHFQAHGGIGRLTLGELAVGLVTVDKLELEVSELGTDPGAAPAERFQRRRTRLRALAARLVQPALDERVAQVKKQLAGTGITQLSARLGDGYVSVRARAADGLAAADLSFHVELVGSGAQLRALASTIRVHGHVPTPGPVIADRLLVALTGAGDAQRTAERPSTRGLCDVEFDLVGALLWQVLPPSGWRLPAVSDIELAHIRVARAGIEVGYGPSGARPGELGVGKHALQLAAAHDLMHSVDDQLRGGHLEDAMRGYRGLLASGGPDQPLLLERILALAAARPAWFPDGLELARQALGRWPAFVPAHAALASITLAQGDAREAARHLEDVARMASAGGDDDQAALAALAAARLLRVLDPRAATQLYQLALEHDPGSIEAADSLTDRLADEQRWSELVRLVRTRIALAEPPRAVQLHLRLADVFVHQLGDRTGAHRELTAARDLAPDDPAVHEMTATILADSDPAGAAAAWREVARLAERRGDPRTCARAWARLGDLLAGATARPEPGAAEDAWRRSLELDPMQTDALIGLASAAADRNDHAIAVELYERLRGLGLPQAIAARHELALARSLIALGRTDDARASLRRATLAGGEPAAEAHATLAEIADARLDREHAATELDTAIAALIELAAGAPAEADRLYTRAAQLAVERATLFDRSGQPIAAGADWQRAHALARQAAPEIARDAARTLLARSGDDAGLERRWIDAVLATRPPPAERAALLVRRADVRRRERFPDLAAALADLHEAVELTEELAERDPSADPGQIEPGELGGGDPAGLAGGAGGKAPRGIEPIEQGGGDPAGVAGGARGKAPRGTAATEIRRSAYQLEAELFAQSGDQRARAQSLAAIARLAERAADRVESEAAAAAAWLAADEPAAALPHGARAHASLSSTSVPAALRREVLVTLGEAAWRQRAWPDVIRAYRGLLDDPGPEAHRQTTFRYRLAVAADRLGDAALALGALRPLTDDPDATRGASPELRSHALRLFADLAERAGELAAAAAALEGFAAIGGESSAAARADAVYRAGELFRRLDRGDDAIRCLETALRISDNHLPALDALEVAWRERGDLERVATVLGRKVAATVRQPGRQKPLLSRLGDLQDQLGRADVALATHQRALEIDPMWRPSLRHVTLRLRDAGQVVAAAGGLAQLAGDLHGDHSVDLAIVAGERQIAAEALSDLVAKLDDAQVEAVRAVARPALERAALDNADVAAGLARLRGEAAPGVPSPHSEAETHSGRVTGRAHDAASGPASLREAAARARAAGKLDDAFATLETVNHVRPGDPTVLRELVEIATELHDNPAAVRHLIDLAGALTGARRGDAMLELADVYYDRLDDAVRGRDAMRQAAEAFSSGSRRDATLRLLASEAGAHLAWDVVVEALLEIPAEKRTLTDLAGLAIALMRAGRDADALSAIEAATAAGRFDDDGELIRQIQREIQRKIALARSLEERATAAVGEEAAALLDEAQQLRIAIGQPGSQPLRDLAAPEGEAPKADTAPWPVRTKTKPGVPNKQVPPAPAASRPRATPPPRGRGADPPGAPAGSPAASITILDPDQDVRSSPGIALPDVDPGARSSPALAVQPSDDDPSARRDDSAVPVAIPIDEPTARRSRPAIAILLSDDDPSARRDDSAVPVAIPVDEPTAPRSIPAIALAVPAADADQAAPRSSPALAVPPADADQAAPRSSPALAVPAADADADQAAPRSSPAIPVPASDRAVDEPPLAGAVTGTAGASDDTPSIPRQQTQRQASGAPGTIATESGAHSSPTDAAPSPGAPPPAPPGEAAPGAAPTAPSALGRIKLVPRVVTRAGVAAPRPDDPAAPRASGPPSTGADDTSGEWQSVSEPDLRSGPWLPPGAGAHPPPRLTGRRSAAPTREISRGPGSSGASRPAGDAAVEAGPPAATATASEVPASDTQAAAQPRHAATVEPAGESAALVPPASEPIGTESNEAEPEDAPPPGYNIAPPERPTSRIRLTSMPPELIGEAASEPPAQGVASSERPTSRIRLSSEALAAAERLAATVLAPDRLAAGRSAAASGSAAVEADAGARPAPDDATAAERSPSRRLTAVFPAVTVHGLDPSETGGEPPAPEPAPPDGDAEPRPSRRVTAVYPAVTVPAELDPSANEAAAPPPAPARAAQPPASHEDSAAGSSPTPRRSTATFPPVLIPPAFPAPPPDGTASEPASSTASASPAAAPDGSGGDAPGPRRSTAAYPAATVRPASGLPSRANRPGSQPSPGAAPEPPATEPEMSDEPDADAEDAISAPETAVPDSTAPGPDAARDLPIAAESPSPPAAASPVERARPASPAPPPAPQPSVTITGTPEETQLAVLLAAASADRERLFAARRAEPDDPAVLLALLAHLGDREPAVRRELLDEVVRTGHGRALAIALHELAVLARESRDPLRATALWTRAYETDPTYPPVWMPLADAFAASDDYAAARELYEMIAASGAYDATRREFAAERAEALGRDASIVSGEIAPRPMTDLEEAEQLAAAEDWPGALDAAERAVAAHPDDVAALEVLERIYFASGNVTAASDAVGRQLMLVDDPAARAGLWRRRARMYREALGRDAEAYRCLKEAHACSPADPEVAYQLRTAAMVRGEWQLAASLMYR